MKKIIVGIFVLLVLGVGVWAMNIGDVQTAWLAGDTVYYAPQSVYDYLAWQKSTLVGAPFSGDTNIPSGRIERIRNVPVVVGGVIVDKWYAIVNGEDLPISRLYASQAEFKTALQAALLNKVTEASAIAALDTAFADSVLDIGTSVLNLSTTTLDFGSSTTDLAVDITNTGDGRLNWTTSTSLPAKISISPGTGDTLAETDTITITVDRSGVAAGTYNPTVTVSGDNESITIDLTIVVP